MPRANSLIAVLALCTLGGCIGPGLEPPKGQANDRQRGPGSHDEAGDASTPTGSGNFGNAGNTSGGTDGTTDPDSPGPTPAVPPVDMGQPVGEGDEDAGTDPADSP